MNFCNLMQKTENTENYVKKVDIWPDLLEICGCHGNNIYPYPALVRPRAKPDSLSKTCYRCGTKSKASQRVSPGCFLIDQFRYVKIQSQTIDLRTRLYGINLTNSVFISKSLVLRSIVWGWILIYRNWSIAIANSILISYINLYHKHRLPREFRK